MEELNLKKLKDQLNEIYMNDALEIKRNYCFLDLKESELNDIKFLYDKNKFKKVTVKTIDYDLIKASCVFDELSKKDFSSLINLLEYNTKLNNAKKRKELSEKLYDANKDIKPENINNLKLVLENINKNLEAIYKEQDSLINENKKIISNLEEGQL